MVFVVFVGEFQCTSKLGRRFHVIFTEFVVFVGGDRDVKSYVLAGVIRGVYGHVFWNNWGHFKTVQIGPVRLLTSMNTRAWKRFA